MQAQAYKRTPNLLSPDLTVVKTYGVGVKVAVFSRVGETLTGVPNWGVLVGGAGVLLGMGVTRFTGTTITCPTKISFSLAISFSSLIASTVLLKRQGDRKQRVAHLHPVFYLRAAGERCWAAGLKRAARIRAGDGQQVAYPDDWVGRVQVVDRDQQQQVHIKR